MVAQCISNTTRVCPKAKEKHFFLLRLIFLLLFSARMGRQFLDIEAEHLDIEVIQRGSEYRRAESRRRLGRPILAFECPENTSFYSNEPI